MLLRTHRMDRALAEAGRLNLPAAPKADTMIGAEPVTVVRAATVVFILLFWEAIAQAGLLYRDVVPSLLAIGTAIVRLLSASDYYWHLGVTAGEVGIGLALGGLSGLVAGLALGGNRVLSKAFEPYLYYLGPTPKIIFFPVMIMWFGVGPGSKIAIGAISCFFPIALSTAACMRQIDKGLTHDGSLRPAPRHRGRDRRPRLPSPRQRR